MSLWPKEAGEKVSMCTSTSNGAEGTGISTTTSCPEWTTVSRRAVTPPPIGEEITLTAPGTSGPPQALRLIVTLSVPAATAGDSSAFNDVAGLIELKPASAADNGGITLRVPYYLVPRALSDVDTKLGRYHGAKLTAKKEIPNHQGDGTKFVYQSEYTEAAVGK